LLERKIHIADKIAIPEKPSSLRPSNLIRVYCQSYLRHCGDVYDASFLPTAADRVVG
jgi:hypothetical protein